ncbi:CidA/LrgA family protein [Deinococcus sp. Leaf326]|uniref:CidA/LrgA family protein n=1 Tax=Deinococcus sp. Leaf326 TaxID=1736338 RepID=UPI0007001D20|nr:CidA/LrgA family protein [Deinococcus sp. Leaf326]KQR40712.1 murein hydrolase transporter LrgA [Deinococcus sp. Leaf326]
MTGSWSTQALPPALRFVLGLGLLLAFAALGQALATGLGLPLPGSVLGMALLWGALGAGAVRLHWVAPAADGLLGVLGLLFVPATAGVVDYLSAGAQWGLWLLVMASGLLLGAGVAGLVAARLVRPEPSSQDGAP